MKLMKNKEQKKEVEAGIPPSLLYDFFSSFVHIVPFQAPIV
jgi:hypothetical protein